VREAPFYGGHVSSWLLCTLDGLTINEDFQVLTPDNEPIEGLYAIGNDAGDYFVGNYPELIVGAAVGRSLTFGYLLGNAFTA
jgi:predicted oxidoreductase